MIKQRLTIGKLSQAKFAGGEIGVGKAKRVAINVNRSEIIRAFGVEQMKFTDRAGANNLSDVARHNFAGLRFARLIADRDATPSFNQLRDVGLGCMKGDAA